MTTSRTARGIPDATSRRPARLPVEAQHSSDTPLPLALACALTDVQDLLPPLLSAAVDDTRYAEHVALLDYVRRHRGEVGNPERRQRAAELSDCFGTAHPLPVYSGRRRWYLRSGWSKEARWGNLVTLVLADPMRTAGPWSATGPLGRLDAAVIELSLHALTMLPELLSAESLGSGVTTADELCLEAVTTAAVLTAGEDPHQPLVRWATQDRARRLTALHNDATAEVIANANDLEAADVAFAAARRWRNDAARRLERAVEHRDLLSRAH